MSTRGTFGFRINGQTYAFYSGSDSYPDALGEFMIKYIKKTGLKSNKTILNKVKSKLLANMDFSANQSEEIENLNGAELYELLKRKVKVENAVDFMDNELFCEYSYIIDLDSGNLKIYQSGDELVDTIPLDNIIKDELSSLVSRIKGVTTGKIFKPETLLYRLEQKNPQKNMDKFYEIRLFQDEKSSDFRLETHRGRNGFPLRCKVVLTGDYSLCLNAASKIRLDKESKGYYVVTSELRK